VNGELTLHRTRLEPTLTRRARRRELGKNHHLLAQAGVKYADEKSASATLMDRSFQHQNDVIHPRKARAGYSPRTEEKSSAESLMDRRSTREKGEELAVAAAEAMA
jgi:hypothetical protein